VSFLTARDILDTHHLEGSEVPHLRALMPIHHLSVVDRSIVATQSPHALAQRLRVELRDASPRTSAVMSDLWEPHHES
jgi:hypothetical protein